MNLSRSFRLTWLVPLLLAFSISLCAQHTPQRPLITNGIDETRITALKGNTHPLARPEFDRGAAPLDLPMQRMLLVLKRSAEQETALRALLDDQQDKASPNYHGWLTPEQFGQQFGPADQDIQTITSWLGSHGFQVNRVTKGRTIIEFSGTADKVKEAFHTQIHKYVVNGEEHWANSSDPAIPSALAPVIAGITTLHNFPRKPLHHFARDSSQDKDTGRLLSSPRSQLSPLFTVGGGCGLNQTACYVVGPYDFATIYNVLPLWNSSPPIDGTGQIIGIVGQSDIDLSDIVDFHNTFGLPAPNVNIIVDGADPDFITQTDQVESSLDVEWSSAIAKGATIDFVTSATTNTSAGVDLSALYIIDNNLAPILSESYGLCELDLGTTGNQFFNQLWQQAAAEGITVFVATGDSGSAVCDRDAAIATQGLSVSGISSTPYNVAVGGTDFNDLQNPGTYWNSTNNPTTQASAKSYIPEMSWNDTCTNSEFFQFTGKQDAESNCNDSDSIFWPRFLTPVGGSGGASNCTTSTGQAVSSCAGGYAKPSWQAGTGVPNDGKRDLPDVSLFAADGLNAHSYIVCQFDGLGGCIGDPTNGTPIGGTSASAPAFAAIMAMVNQKTQARQGNANYVFYALAPQPGASCDSSGTPASSCIFYDVTTGTISTPCTTGSTNCVTNVSGDQNGVLSGFDTTAGYDLATGLGSVNVANLVDHWNSVSFTPTAITLSVSPTSNIAHGSPVNVNISVAPKTGSGVPTGLVSLQTSTGQDAGTFTLANGSVSGSTGLLPGGTYNVTAHYAGDGTYAASNSTPGIPVTVNSEPSVTSMQVFTLDQNGNAIPFTTGTYGANIFFRATVAGQSNQGVPTGAVNVSETFNGQATTFGSPGSPGNPFPLNSEGYVNGFAGILPAGAYVLTANYSGDNSFESGTSAALNFNVTRAQTATSAPVVLQCTQGVVPCRIPAGTTVVVGAAISSNTDNLFSSPPTGTLTLFANNVALGPPVTVQSSGGDIGAQLPLGQDTLTAQYSGDSNYSGSTSSPTIVDVGQTFTMTISTEQINIAAPGQSGSAVLTLTPQNGLTGTAQLTPPLCTGLPPQSSCSFSPTSITFDQSTTTVPVTVTVSTTKSGSAAGSIRGRIPRPWQMSLQITAVGIMGICIMGPLIRRPRRLSATLILILLTALVLGISCGGGNGGGPGSGAGGGGGGTGGTGGGGGTGGSSSGTPVGLYQNVTVTITVNGVSQFVAFNVNVQ